MFEELSYSYKLNKTQHPRIMSTVDSGLSGEELTLLLDATVDAIALIITKSFQHHPASLQRCCQ